MGLDVEVFGRSKLTPVSNQYKRATAHKGVARILATTAFYDKMISELSSIKFHFNKRSSKRSIKFTFPPTRSPDITY